ncbi:hypothetical protein KC131_23920 [Pseudomonas sp. JQ170]|uniref:hypothetical protein n=1 Tax=unclassified Pseudomonas TaxID=196821 RepID=UPI000FB36ACB|nr:MULTISPECIES: hypothetical protein [unclassified Pseudomonas]MDN7143702.1 hypothetical protein [Pseudomonas sp. JQ170]WRO74129.1 hypothetical protein U9R80_16515 [Pseudomonas sp. 170C]
MKGSRSTTCDLTLSLLVACFLAGCAQNPDIRKGDDYTSGTTVKAPPDYVVCVQDELPGGSKTYTVTENNTLKLFVDSTDPNKASGLVEVHSSGSQHQFSAYQRDAWYDKGRLLDAALMCSHT